MKKREKHQPIRELPPDHPPPDALDAASPPDDAGVSEQSQHAEDSPAPERLATDAPAASPEDAVDSDPVATLEQRHAEMESKYLRAAADLQNYARRARQNIEDAREQQLMDVARALLPVLDHFDHALEVDPAKTSPDALLKGVQIVRDELLGALERFGVKRVEVKQGDVFDPNRHEAMMRQAVEGLGPDLVATQFQPGYVLAEKTLRPAKVTVTE